MELPRSESAERETLEMEARFLSPSHTLYFRLQLQKGTDMAVSVKHMTATQLHTKLPLSLTYPPVYYLPLHMALSHWKPEIFLKKLKAIPLKWLIIH